jgi:hypothetical protein
MLFLSTLHRNRPVREILRQARWQRGADLVLDDANDATLDDLGRVSERNSRWHFIGDVSHLHGAARVSAALAVLSAYRGK